MKRFGLVAALLLTAQVAHAQPWGYDESWGQTSTPAIAAVRAALDRGLFGAPAIAYLKAQGWSAEVAPSGAPWPCQAVHYRCIMWYDKGPDGGNFQLVPPAGGDSVYASWDIGVDARSWADGPGFITIAGRHPTKWALRVVPGTTIAPQLLPAGACVTPFGTPCVEPPPPPPPPPGGDFTAQLAAAVAAINAHTDASVKLDGDQTRAQVDQPGWFKRLAGDRYVQMLAAAVATCVATPQCRQSLFTGSPKP